jgi:hypothetical protein
VIVMVAIKDARIKIGRRIIANPSPDGVAVDLSTLVDHNDYFYFAL